MTIPSQKKNPDQKIFFQNSENFFGKNMFSENFGIFFENENFEILISKSHNFRCSIFFWKKTDFFQIFLKIFFSENIFRILKKYFLIGICFLTRYGHVLCKNDSLGSLRVSQRRTARHTANIFRKNGRKSFEKMVENRGIC